jgi:hypothetical protein
LFVQKRYHLDAFALEVVKKKCRFVCSNSLPFVSGKFKSIVIIGRSWSDGSDSAAVDSSSQLVGGSLATEGVRTALAQLLNLHGMHVNGLEPFVGHPSAHDSGGKWY